MAKKKNKNTNELDTESVELSSSDISESANPSGTETQEDHLVSQASDAKDEEPKEEPKEEKALPETKIKEKNTDFSSLESIAKFVTKSDPTFSTSFVSLNRGSNSLLIKQTGGVYCFCRVVPRSRNHNGQIWEAEFLTNVPAQVHTKLVKILKEAEVPDSKRQFFNPSGLL